MADTTKANILIIAPELSTVSDDAFTLIIADAAREFTEDEYGDNEEVVQRWWCAHMLTISNNPSGSGIGSGPVKRERVDDVEIEYDNNTSGASAELGYNSTRYGRTFLDYYKKYRKLRSY